MKHQPEFEAILLERHADERVHQDCPCGRGKRDTRCQDCYQYKPRCKHCYIELHKHLITHWAEVYDYTAGYFKRYSLCRIPDAPYVISLGHDGEQCNNALANPSFRVNLVALNGIHDADIRYCACVNGAVDWKQQKAAQLLRAGFLPGSPSNPKNVFAIGLVKHFHSYPQVLYEFVDGIRRATNNAFPADAPVCYSSNNKESWLNVPQDLQSQFAVAERFWSAMTTRRRLGQQHGIDNLLTYRPNGNLSVYCPACPEHGVNRIEGYETVKADLP
jgi:hypothetical protein